VVRYVARTGNKGNIKMNLKYGETMWIGFIWLNIGVPLAGCCKPDDPSDSIKGRSFLDYATTGLYGVWPGYVKLT
jgi:hypothetical protein